VSDFRPVWAEIDLGAVRENVAALRRHCAPAGVMAVVKSNAYGHGAVEVGRAALDAGAAWLGVALVEEGVELRAAGVGAPVLVLSEPTADAAHATVRQRLTPVVYTHAGIEALAKAVVETGTSGPLAVHLKVDTGMHRVGCAPRDAVELATAIERHAELRLDGVCTHLAVADEPDDAYTAEQITRFRAVLDELAAHGIRPTVVHAANTAGAIACADARFDLVRVGIGIYGIAPSAALAGHVPLTPVMSVKARVTHVKRLREGARVSYGLRYRLAREATIATVPIGYGDGVPRNLAAAGGEVLVGGRRHPIAGTVTMDQLMVDTGDTPVEVGDEVVLLGTQGDAEISADEWAARLGTIPYEIVCAIGPRVPRRYLG
jgi:alanine racemase